MRAFVEVGTYSLNKFGEELCGDNVEMVRAKDEVIVVLSDGLGSGVKANILSTLTTKIAVTMLKEGADIHDTVDTIAKTLPVCKVRQLAYSTFGIIKIDKDNNAHIIEYDNPPIIFIRNGNILNVDKKNIKIGEKVIKESSIKLEEDDILILISDGVINAGVGQTLNLGWQWENVANYLKENVKNEKSAFIISKNLIDVCKELYMNKPSDDTTATVVKIRKKEIVNLFTGPPKNPCNDKEFVNRFIKSQGKKIVAGGTAANIIARELERQIDINPETINNEVPPIASIKGIDLVTEGVITLSNVVEKIKYYKKNNSDFTIISEIYHSIDGASRLTKMLIEDCTHLKIWVGKAVNPAHQNPNFPSDLSLKLKIVDELINLMSDLGKYVEKIEI